MSGDASASRIPRRDVRIAYIAMLRDPDGNMVEFSWDQGVFSTLNARWAAAAE